MGLNMGNKLSELTSQELFVIERTGIEATNFLTSNEFYVNHLKPALEVERERAKNGGEWKPGLITDLATIALHNSFCSGERNGLKILEDICARIVNRGLDAGREIERRKKNEKQKAH